MSLFLYTQNQIGYEKKISMHIEGGFDKDNENMKPLTFFFFFFCLLLC